MKKNVKILCLFLFWGVSCLYAQTITPNDGDWSQFTIQLNNTPEGEIMARTGDIDNLGFGWPTGFDPFSGSNTPAHGFPWTPNPLDPSGTDRIMVVTSYAGSPPSGQDGYTNTTSRPGNKVSPVKLAFSFSGTINKAYLFLFLDDFQAPLWQSNFQVFLDGIRVPIYETVINSLLQTGPIGRIVKLPIPNDLLYLLNDGELSILMDDFTTGAGDGFAIDFAKIVINPFENQGNSIIKGNIVDQATNIPLQGVKVYVNGLDSTETDANGNYRITQLTGGIQVLQTYKSGYGAEIAYRILSAGDSVIVNFSLKPGAPMLIFNYPENNQEMVGLNEKIKMKFSLPILSSSFNSFSFWVSNDSGVVSGQYLSTGDTIIFQPDTLVFGKKYTSWVTINLKGTNLVRLDKNYSFSFYTFSPTEISTTIQEKPIRIFPNPGKEIITIYGVENDNQTRISDSFGKVVWDGQLINNQLFLTSKISPGLYFIHLQSKTGGWERVVKWTKE